MTVVSKDTQGNCIYAEKGIVYLKLVSEKRTRKLAEILIESGALVMRREGRHLLRKADAFGFNYELLKSAKKCKDVILCLPGCIYEIPIADILKYGDFLWFKNEGFERQVFLRQGFIKTYPALELVI